MSNTFTQLYFHFIFAVQFRNALIDPSWKGELHKFITGMVQEREHKMLQVNTMPDHLHMVLGWNPDQSASDLVKVVKSTSTKWINQQDFCNAKFRWQERYGVFSSSKQDLPRLLRYIENQEFHHQTMTFREEFCLILKKYEIEFDERYIFKEPI